MKKTFLQKAKKQVQESYTQDAYAIQAVRSMDDLDQTNSLLSQRLEEWFKIHFPHLPLAGEDAAYYVAHLNDEAALLKKWSEDKLSQMKEKQQTGFGAALEPDDVAAVKIMAKLLLQGYKTRSELEKYVQDVAKKTMPSTCALVDGVLAAKLLSVIGSLEKLARFPASTLQVLGAETALFKHLRKGTLPPKHGLIFQSPYVNGQPFDKRGKAARALAGKLAIALKADFFTHHDIGPKLKKDLETRMSQIQKLPTRNIQPHDYRDFAERRFERRGPPRDSGFRGGEGRRFGGGDRKSGGFSSERPGGFRQDNRDRGFRSERSEGFRPRSEGFRTHQSDERPRVSSRPSVGERDFRSGPSESRPQRDFGLSRESVRPPRTSGEFRPREGSSHSPEGFQNRPRPTFKERQRSGGSERRSGGFGDRPREGSGSSFQGGQSVSKPYGGSSGSSSGKSFGGKSFSGKPEGFRKKKPWEKR